MDRLAATMVLLATLACASLHAASLPAAPRFQALGVAEGLPSSVVYQLAQDPAGFIWIGTEDGLVRYDGVDMRVYRHDRTDPHSLSANQVATMLIDRDGNLWTGGEASGLNRMLDGSGRFEHWRHQPENPDSLGSDDVWALAQDSSGAIWAGTYRGGLNRLNEDGSFLRVGHEPGNPHSLNSDIILSLHADDQGRLWIGTDIGLDVRDSDGIITHVDLSMLDAPDNRLHVPSLLGEPDGSVLVGTRRGVVRIGAQLEYLGRVAEGLAQPATISMRRDSKGALWIGTLHGAGLLDGDGLRHIAPAEGTPGALPGPRVASILCDHEGGLWLGLLDGGVQYLPPHWRNFASFQHQPGNPDSLAHSVVGGLALDTDNALYVVSATNGLDRIEPRSGQVRRLGEVLDGNQARLWTVLPVDGQLWLGMGTTVRALDFGSDAPVLRDKPGAPMPQGRVEHLLRAADGTVWAVSVGGGVVHLDSTFTEIDRYLPDNQRLDDTDIKGIALDADDVPCLATASGVACLERERNRFERVANLPEEPVDALAFAADGSLWLHRLEALERYRRGRYGWQLTTQFGATDGFPAMSVTGIVPTVDGTLWVTTARGLWRVDTRMRTLYRFSERDGLPSSEFIMRPPVVRSDGVIHAGTRRGVIAFDPAAVETTLSPAPVALTALRVRRAGNPVDLDPRQPLQLRYGDRDLTIQVRALSFANPTANRYRFRLGGFEDDWLDSLDLGQRMFSQLPAGRYELHVQARNAGAPWSDLAQALQIRVAPPPWATPWARAGYVVASALLLLAIFANYRARIQRRHALALAVTRRRAAEQLAAAKSNFLTMMSHEIRTPLTGVLGMTELLMGQPLDERQRGYARAIQQSGSILLRVVNDSLDLARIRAGRLALDVQPLDPAALVQGVLKMCEGAAAPKGLRLEAVVFPGTPAWVLGDQTRIEQILLNMVGNACKFTEQGSVTVELAGQDDGQLRLTVRDTGPGMTAQLRERLFERFEQADGDTARRHGGSGLGLAICRELVELMSGSINVTSTPGEGSTFVVTLPLPAVAGPADPGGTTDAQNGPSAGSPGPLDVLLVEDDDTSAQLVGDLLAQRGHRITRVDDALAALAHLQTQRCQLAIISIALRGIDGVRLAAMIRTLDGDAATLPVLGITADGNGDGRVATPDAGVDGWLRKPFSGAQLERAISSLRGIRR